MTTNRSAPRRTLPAARSRPASTNAAIARRCRTGENLDDTRWARGRQGEHGNRYADATSCATSTASTYNVDMIRDVRPDVLMNSLDPYLQTYLSSASPIAASPSSTARGTTKELGAQRPAHRPEHDGPQDYEQAEQLILSVRQNIRRLRARVHERSRHGRTVLPMPGSGVTPASRCAPGAGVDVHWRSNPRRRKARP